MTHRTACLALLLALVLVPRDVFACPICFGGDPDSQLAQSVNWAVILLLGVTGSVLSGFVGFMGNLSKRSRQALGRPEGDHIDG